VEWKGFRGYNIKTKIIFYVIIVSEGYSEIITIGGILWI